MSEPVLDRHPALDWLILQGKITEKEALTALVCERTVSDDE